MGTAANYKSQMDRPKIFTTSEQMSNCLRDFIEGKIELNRRETFQYVYTASNVENLKKVRYYNDAKLLKKKLKKAHKKKTYKETDSVSCLDVPEVDTGTPRKPKNNNKNKPETSKLKIQNKASTSLRFDVKNFDKRSRLKCYNGKSSSKKSSHKSAAQLFSVLNGLWQFWSARKRSDWLKIEVALNERSKQLQTTFQIDRHKLYELLQQPLTALYEKHFANTPNYPDRTPILPFPAYATLKNANKKSNPSIRAGSKSNKSKLKIGRKSKCSQKNHH